MHVQYLVYCVVHIGGCELLFPVDTSLELHRVERIFPSNTEIISFHDVFIPQIFKWFRPKYFKTFLKYRFVVRNKPKKIKK